MNAASLTGYPKCAITVLEHLVQMKLIEGHMVYTCGCYGKFI